MLDVLKQLGKEEVERIDEPLAREVGREARASALLLASIRRLGDAYVVEMRALDPLHDEYVFTVSDRAFGQGGRHRPRGPSRRDDRRRLGVAVARRPAGPRPVAAVTTTSVKAWELLSRSRAAFDQGAVDEARATRPGGPGRRTPISPWPTTRPLSVATWGFHRRREARRNPTCDAAVRLADRLPERERLATLAPQGPAGPALEGASASGIRRRPAIPSTRRRSSSRATSGYHRVRIDEAIPYFRQAVRLDPELPACRRTPTDAIVEAGLAGENLPWLREQVPQARTSSGLQSIGGPSWPPVERRRPSPLFRRAAELDAGTVAPEASRSTCISFTGRAAEAERRAARAWLEANPADGDTRFRKEPQEGGRDLCPRAAKPGKAPRMGAHALAAVVPGPKAALRRRQARPRLPATPPGSPPPPRRSGARPGRSTFRDPRGLRGNGRRRRPARPPLPCSPEASAPRPAGSPS